MEEEKKTSFVQIWNSSNYDIPCMNLCNTIVAQLLSRGKDRSVSGGLVEKERKI